jgi:hypothetical protein
MEGMWFRQCPKCGNYFKKCDPPVAGICCVCGWEEHVNSFYCEIVHKDCILLSTGAQEREALLDPRHRK